MSNTRKLAIKRAQQEKRGCLVTGIRVMHGHNVSKSNVKTKRLFKANISDKNLFSPVLGAQKVKISRRGERTIDKYGGLDNFLLKCKKRNLTLSALKLKDKLLQASPVQENPHLSNS